MIAVHVPAGLVGTAFVTAGILSASGGFPPVRVLAVFAAATWPVVMSLGLVVGFGSKAWTRLCVGYGLTLLALGVAAQALGLLRGSFWQIPAMWLLVNAIPTALCLVFLRRSLRPVTPILFALWTIAGAAAWGLVHVAATQMWTARIVARATDVVGLPLQTAPFAVFATGLLLSLPFVTAAFFLLVHIYEWRWASDQSLLLDATWFLFIISSAIVGGSDMDFATPILCVLGFPAYWLMKRVGMHLAQRGVRAAGPAVLILRVFALGKRSEGLFDRLTGLWRYVGPVQLVAGVDLASRIMQPQTCFSFAAQRLESRYIKSEHALRIGLAQSEETRDPDGRFRVDEFFCYSNTWFDVVAALARRSDATVMDLRGMKHRENSGGWERELCELFGVMPLERVVLLVDETTDQEYLDNLVRDAWRALPVGSPNAGRRVEEVNLNRVAGRADLDRAVKRVFDVVPFEQHGARNGCGSGIGVTIGKLQRATTWGIGEDRSTGRDEEGEAFREVAEDEHIGEDLSAGSKNGPLRAAIRTRFAQPR